MKIQIEELNREREELMKRHDEEKKRMMMMMMMEEERQKQETERNRREEEFREREERYKRLIKEREQKENELIEQMKLEQMQKQTPEERLRRDEEKQKSELHKRLQSPVSDQTTDLNVVLLGKRGAGKSASGNTILGRQAFISKKSVRPVTQDVTVESGSFCELPVTVYDTPGLFDTKISDEEIQQMINEKVLQKCSSGLCVFLLVIRADRFTEDDRKTVEKIEKMLGEKHQNNIWILFTRGDELEEENTTIQEFIEEIEELKTLVQKYEHRYHLFNNKKMRTSEQVKMLFTKILKNYSDTAAGAENLLRKIPANIGAVSRVSSPPSRRIVLVGISGVGKSAAGNTILGQKEFTSVMSTNSVTRKCSAAQATVSGRSVSVVDTPGLFDTQMKPEELMMEIARSVYISSPGPHAFLIVFPVNMRFTKQEQQILQKIELMFGEEVLKYSIILFTHGDLLDGEPLEKRIEENCRLRSLVQQCGGRYHVFNNRDEENREQVEDLLQKIDSMIQQNGGGHYSNQMYEDALRFRQEERERKQREEEQIKQQVEKQSQNCVCS
nr:GTPase IMAP family member 8-like [Danio rerio]|eukprot:XP_021328168.1 GTPase IMAP family member 8-like [Danio rerio]